MSILESLASVSGLLFESVLEWIKVKDLYNLAITNPQLHHLVTTSDKYIYLKKITRGSYQLELIKTATSTSTTEISLIKIKVKRSCFHCIYYQRSYFEPDLCINNFGNSKQNQEKISDFFNVLVDIEKEFENGDESRIDCIITFDSGLEFQSEVVVDSLSLESDLELDFVNKVDFVKTKLNSQCYDRAKKWFDQWVESFLSNNSLWTTTSLNLSLHGKHRIHRQHSYTNEYYRCVKCKKWNSQ